MRLFVIHLLSVYHLLLCKLVHPPSVNCCLLTDDPKCMTPELQALCLLLV